MQQIVTTGKVFIGRFWSIVFAYTKQKINLNYLCEMSYEDS